MKEKVKKGFNWCISPEGRKDLGALVAAVTAIYTGLHRTGITP